MYCSNRPSILRLFHVVASTILTKLWIILILVPFRKCRLGKRLTFVHFTLPFLIKCWNKIIKQIIHNIFKFLHCKQRYKFILLGHDLIYFVKHETNRKACYTKNEDIRILEFLINILVRVWLTLFSTKNWPSLGSKLCPLLVDICINSRSYQAWHKRKLIKHKGITEAKEGNLSFRYIDDHYSVNDLPYWVA